MARKREIEPSALAERRMAALFARVWNLGRLAAERAIERGARRREIRKAIAAELRDPGIRSQLRAIGRTVADQCAATARQGPRPTDPS